MNFMTTNDNTEIDQEKFWVDLCLTVHITNNMNNLIDLQPWRQAVRTGGGTIYSTHKGTVTTNNLRLENTLCAPEFPKKLISVQKLGGKLLISDNTGSLQQGEHKVGLVMD